MPEDGAAALGAPLSLAMAAAWLVAVTGSAVTLMAPAAETLRSRSASNESFDTLTTTEALIPTPPLVLVVESATEETENDPLAPMVRPPVSVSSLPEPTLAVVVSLAITMAMPAPRPSLPPDAPFIALAVIE